MIFSFKIYSSRNIQLPDCWLYREEKKIVYSRRFALAFLSRLKSLLPLLISSSQLLFRLNFACFFFLAAAACLSRIRNIMVLLAGCTRLARLSWAQAQVFESARDESSDCPLLLFKRDFRCVHHKYHRIILFHLLCLTVAWINIWNVSVNQARGKLCAWTLKWVHYTAGNNLKSDNQLTIKGWIILHNFFKSCIKTVRLGF